MGILLADNTHSIRSPMPLDCQSIGTLDWIGRLQIRPIPRIWLKPRLLIGRELKMLASHWSRGPSGKFQRGYPNDPKPIPIERYWPWLALDWFISGPANRLLPSIEGSERLANPEMNPVLLRQGPMNPIDPIGTTLDMHWHCIGSSKVWLIGRLPL